MSINNQMKSYNYYTTGALNDYGQPVIDTTPKGTIEMAINIRTFTTKDYILYSSAEYIGLTAAPVDDTYIIEYGAERLKILYVNKIGRLNQCIMERMK